MQRQYGYFDVICMEFNLFQLNTLKFLVLVQLCLHKRYTFLNVTNDIFSEEVEDEVDAYELLQAVDILAMLPKDFYDKIVWVPLNYSQ